MSNKYKYRCKFCEAGFILEDRYLAHRCKQMQRDEELRSPRGLAAWEYYKTWLEFQRKRAPKMETFVTSKYYTSMTRFFDFVQRVGIQNPRTYIRRMVSKDIPPTLWVNDEIYSDYLRYVDKGTNPMQAAEDTINFLFKVADKLECDTGDIFEIMDPDSVIMCLRRRQMTPWILLHSPKFKKFVETVSEEQRQALTAIIKPASWKQLRADNPEVVEAMKEFVRELNL